MSSPPQAEYRQLGKSGLRLSVPVYGAMSVGSEKWIPWVVGEEKALPILKAAWDAGVTTFDTANCYSNGESERIIGTFIKKYDIPREKLIIATKAFYLVHPDPTIIGVLYPHLPTTRDFVNQGGLSRGALMTQVEGSLRRLGTTYIDLLQVHYFDPDTPFEETMRALHDLVVSGKVRYIGASNLRAWHVAAMNGIAAQHGWTQFVSVQVEHSLLYRPEEKELFAYCKYAGLGVLTYSPLMDGYLARPVGTLTTRTQSMSGSPFEKPRRESDKKIIGRVEELAKKHGWSMAQVALAWSRSKGAFPIVGANSPQRLIENVITDIVLTDDEIAYLEEPYEFQPYRF